MTAHKAQGQTNKGYSVIYPTEKEPAENGLYVMMSRSTRLDHVHIYGGASYDRMTKALQKKGFKARDDEEERLAKIARLTEQKVWTL